MRSVIHSDEMAVRHGVTLGGLIDLILDGVVDEPIEVEPGVWGWETTDGSMA